MVLLFFILVIRVCIIYLFFFLCLLFRTKPIIFLGKEEHKKGQEKKRKFSDGNANA